MIENKKKPVVKTGLKLTHEDKIYSTKSYTYMFVSIFMPKLYLA